jgi:hypothetical protein
MSDFLERLANRALGTAPIIRPRRPARFEPLAPGAFPAELSALAFGPHDGTETLSPAPQPESATQPEILRDARSDVLTERSAAVEHAQPRSLDGPPPATTDQTGAFSPLAAVQPRSNPIERAAVLPRPRHGRTTRDSELGVPEVPPVFTPTMPSDAGSLEGAETGALLVDPSPAPRSSSLDHRPSQRAPAALDDPDASAVAPPLARRQTTTATRAESWSTPRPASRPTDPTVRRERPGRDADQDSWGDPSSDVAETTIQVTIGRIEIHATHAPASESRTNHARNSVPALGLNAYLRRRAAEGSS